MANYSEVEDDLLAARQEEEERAAALEEVREQDRMARRSDVDDDYYSEKDPEQRQREYNDSRDPVKQMKAYEDSRDPVKQQKAYDDSRENTYAKGLPSERKSRFVNLNNGSGYSREVQPGRLGNPQDLAKDYAKNLIKDAAKEEAAALASAAGSAIAASAPVWGPILGIILGIVLIFGLVIMVFTAIIAKCNEDGISGTATRVASKVASWAGIIPADVCAHLAINDGGASGGAGASGNFDKLDIVLTSAYRPGAIVAGTGRPSAHGRGEAVDIALRNPTVPERSTDPRIAELLQIVNSAGFIGPPTQSGAAADALDEYTNPTEGASAGHIHIEFNTKSDGTTYCDNTKVVNPPNDLVAIPANIPMSGVSNPKLRPCMLDKVEQIFSAAGVTTANP